MPEHDDRRFGQPELRGGQHAPVPGDQFPVLANEAGHGPAELGHTRGDLRDLVRAVHLRVFRVGLEARKRPGLDPLGGEGEGHGVILFDRVARAHRRAGAVDSEGGSNWIPRVDPGGGFKLDSGVQQVSTRGVQLDV